MYVCVCMFECARIYEYMYVGMNVCVCLIVRMVVYTFL